MRFRAGVWLAMLLFLFAPPAQAELVGEFNARLKEVKRSYGGAYTVVADARVYGTTGAPPPAAATVHFPAGAARGRWQESSRS